MERLDKTRNSDRLKNKLIKLYKNKEKGNKDLLREELKKWRKNVERENVGILKSKIIYKIYDKNSSGKDKDLLNKYLEKWEWESITFKDNIHKYKRDIDKIS